MSLFCLSFCLLDQRLYSKAKAFVNDILRSTVHNCLNHFILDPFVCHLCSDSHQCHHYGVLSIDELVMEEEELIHRRNDDGVGAIE